MSRTNAKARLKAEAHSDAFVRQKPKPGLDRRQGALAGWYDPAVLPAGELVQVRLANGAIHDGMLDRAPMHPRVWIWRTTATPRAVPAIMGWLPKAARTTPIPSETVGILEVYDRVFSALRTLRYVRVEQGPKQASAAWPREWSDLASKINAFADGLGHQSADGTYVPRDQYQAGYTPPETPPREVYTPSRREMDTDVMLLPLDWFARLQRHHDFGVARRNLSGVGLSAVAGVLDEHEQTSVYLDRAFNRPGTTVQQQIVWDRSLAFLGAPGTGDQVRPPSWAWVAKWNKCTPMQAQRSFEDAMRTMWFFANGGG